MRAQSITLPEEWRPVVGYEDIYAVSDRGRVLNIQRNRFLRPRPDRGYLRVALGYRGRRDVGIHVLVLSAFVGPAPLGYECNHRDANKANNSLANLEWVTKSDNSQHALRHGRMRFAHGEDHPNSKLTEQQVRYIRSMRGVVTGKQLAKEFGVVRQLISAIQLRQSWTWVD